MAYRSGLAAQFMIGEESTCGVAVTPTVTIPFLDESLTADYQRLESAAIRAGRGIIDSEAWNGGPVVVGGDLGFELTNRSLTKLWKHCLGSVNTTGPGPYTHTFTPGDLSGLGLTVQVGRPTIGGSTIPFTYSGCKVASWELACSAGEIATFGVSLTGIKEQANSRVVTDGVTTNTDATVESENANFTQADVGKSISGTGIPTGAYIASVTDENTIEISAAATATGTGVSLTIGTALASASYSADIKPLKFNHGTVTVGGTAFAVKSATISGDNGLNTDRLFLGSKNYSEALPAALKSITGELVAEFDGVTQYESYVKGDELAIVLAFSNGTDSVTITTNARYDTAAVNVAGTDILEQTLPFKCIGDGSDADAFTVVVVNSDSAA